MRNFLRRPLTAVIFCLIPACFVGIGYWAHEYRPELLHDMTSYNGYLAAGSLRGEASSLSYNRLGVFWNYLAFPAIISAMGYALFFCLEEATAYLLSVEGLKEEDEDKESSESSER